MCPRNLTTEADALASVFGCLQSNADADLIRTPDERIAGPSHPKAIQDLHRAGDLRTASRSDNDED
jgi:hypothetical protein